MQTSFSKAALPPVKINKDYDFSLSLFVFQTVGGFAITLTCSSLRHKDNILHIRQIIGWLLTLFPFLIITIYFFHKVIQEFSKKDNLKAAEVSKSEFCF